MKTQLSSIDIHYLIKELEFLIGGKIDKIYNPSKKELILQFHFPNKGKQQLRIDEKSIYLTEHKFPSEQPTEFCMYLRKKLNNARLRKIKQLGFERIIEFEFETREKQSFSGHQKSKGFFSDKEGKISLVFELFSKGNIILTKDKQILTVAERQKWAAREIAPKKEYVYPEREYNLFGLTIADIEELLSKTNKESIVKSLAIDLGLGGVYAEELCALASIDKDKKPSEAKSVDILNGIEKLLKNKLDPRIVKEGEIVQDITPFELKFYSKFKQEKAKTFSQALDSYFSQEIFLQKGSKHEKQIKKIQEIIKEQEKHIKQLENQEKENKEKAEALYQSYEKISSILKELKEISKNHNWGEIKEKLKGHKVIKEVIPKDKSIVIELNK